MSVALKWEDLSYSEETTLKEVTKAGRPRSEESRQSILEAANKLLLQASVREISIEAVAKKAGVGKTTIYRWWPNKVALILDAVLGPVQQSPVSVTGSSARESFLHQVERFGKIMKGRTGKALAELFAEAQGNKDLLEIFYTGFMLQHEEILANIITQGIGSGEFSQQTDIAVVVDSVYGAVFYRLMSSPDTVDAIFFDTLAFRTLKLLAA